MRGECLEQRPNCPYRTCYSDTHHLFYPRSEYRTKLEKDFRNLDENKVVICRFEHDQIHASLEVPEKPTREVMVQIIQSARNEVA